MPTPLRVLLLEDSPTDAEVMLDHLQAAGYAPAARRTVRKAMGKNVEGEREVGDAGTAPSRR